ncbi:MAG TPA: RimK-like ATPgrasp N-terminal domain-containing protein, partial [Rheinheimera sp.]|nr:RimK-like ATPgrasp N-terminal domain-containing protein [Rheinheimera sp.]
MAKLIIVVDKEQDWAPFYQYDGVMTLPAYLKWSAKNKQRTRVINLCRQAQYLGSGYYCSLLAEARGHNVMPSVRAFNKFNRHEIADIAEEIPGTILTQLNKALLEEINTQLVFNIYFGETEHKALKKVAGYLFEAFPVPILRVELQKKLNWQVKTLKIGSVHKLNEQEQSLFGNTLERYSHKIWRVEPANRKYKYDLAVL